MSGKPDAAAVRVFPPSLPLVTIVLGIALQYSIPISPPVSPPTPARFWLGGLIVVAAILGLGLWSVILVRRTGQTENPWKPTTEIVERGPFRITRNPMYLQMVLVCVGFAIILWNPWIALLTPMCAWILHRFAITPEETYLESKFGGQYLAYKRRVRRWI